MSPLTEKGRKIKRKMRETYGGDSEKAERVFHASRQKGTIRGVDKGRKRKRR